MENMNHSMSDFSRKMETERKNELEILRIKNTVIGMRETYNRIISRLDTTQEESIN